jgi:hypothetical protein
MVASKGADRAGQNGHVGQNLTTHWTGARVSRSLIVDLCVPALNARPVNSGVRHAPLSQRHCPDSLAPVVSRSQ